MRTLDSTLIGMGAIDMKIKELYNIFKYVKNSKSCLILRNDLQLEFFGETDAVMMKFNNEIMKISINRNENEV